MPPRDTNRWLMILPEEVMEETTTFMDHLENIHNKTMQTILSLPVIVSKHETNNPLGIRILTKMDPHCNRDVEWPWILRDTMNLAWKWRHPVLVPMDLLTETARLRMASLAQAELMIPVQEPHRIAIRDIGVVRRLLLCAISYIVLST